MPTVGVAFTLGDTSAATTATAYAPPRFADCLFLICDDDRAIANASAHLPADVGVVVVPGADADAEPANVFERVLDAARGRVDYLLWLGATWRIAGNGRLDKSRLAAAAYRLCSEDAGGIAWTTALLRTDLHWRLDEDHAAPVAVDREAETVRIGSIKLLGTQPDEARRIGYAAHIARLHRRRRTAPGEANAAFWLGVRYQQLGDETSARQWFECRVRDQSGDGAQRAIALYKLALALERDGAAWERLQPAYERSFDLCPDRVEPLLRIIRHYRELGQWQTALALCQTVGESRTPADGYHYDAAAYACELAFERMQCAARLHDHAATLAAANAVLSAHGLPEQIRVEAIARRSAALDILKPIYPIASGIRNRIKVVVPFYNAGEYLRACVESLRRQDYANFHVYLVDDASTDGCAEDLETDCRFTLTRNPERRGALANQCRVIMEHCDAADIVVFVDGDDRLSCDDALSYINRFYVRTGCWVMYGQFELEGGGYGFARPIEADESTEDLFGGRPFRFPIHVRTHRAGLFHRIAEQDPRLRCLKDGEGRYFGRVEDMAHMRAVFQAAGRENVYYNERILYRYSTSNPLSNFRVDPDEQAEASRQVASAPRVEPVKTWRAATDAAGAACAPPTRLLSITLEGMDPDLLQRWSDAGHLPHLGAALRSGSRVPLYIRSRATTTDAFWVSALTGRNPGAHGRFWPIRFADGSYRRVWNDTELAVEPVWDVLSRFGLHSMVCNQYEMPVSREQNVTCIQNWSTHVPREAIASQPEELKDDLLARFDPDRITGMTERLEPITESEFLALRAELRERVDRKLSAYLHYLARGGWDLYQLGFDESHDAGHQMWHVHDTAHGQHRADWLEAHGDPILEIYGHLDRAVGRMIEAAEGAPVMLLIGPGMGRTVLCGNQLDDMLLAIERHHRPDGTAGEPKLADRLFYPQMFSPRIGAVRLNVVGREPAGLVPRGEPYDRWCERLAGHFEALRIAGTDEPAVERVIAVHKVCDGPKVDTLPDLFVVWRVDRDIQAVESPVVGRVEIRRLENNCLSYRTGDHSEKGMLVSSIPLDVSSREPLAVETCAPTIAGLFGVDMPHAEVPGLRAATSARSATEGIAALS